MPSTFDHPLKLSGLIQRYFEQMVTGKTQGASLIRTVLKTRGAPTGQGFLRAALDTMGIRLDDARGAVGPYSQKTDRCRSLRTTGMELVAAMIFAGSYLRVGLDYRIPSPILLTSIDEVAASYMIPVAFCSRSYATAQGRRNAREKRLAHLRGGRRLLRFSRQASSRL